MLRSPFQCRLLACGWPLWRPTRLGFRSPLSYAGKSLPASYALIAIPIPHNIAIQTIILSEGTSLVFQSNQFNVLQRSVCGPSRCCCLPPPRPSVRRGLMFASACSGKPVHGSEVRLHLSHFAKAASGPHSLFAAGFGQRYFGSKLKLTAAALNLASSRRQPREICKSVPGRVLIRSWGFTWENCRDH